VQHALAAYHRGETTEAERLCRLALSAESNYFDALYLSGILAGQAGRAEEAAELLSRAVRANPNVADAYYNRGVALDELGRRAEAVESYERAIALKADYVDAYYNRGVALRELQRPEDALASFDRAIALRADYAEAHHNRGVVLGRLQRHADALESYERAIALRPGYAEAHNSRGAALSELGRTAEAVESYTRAVSLRPDYAHAHNNRGLALADLDRPAEALQDFERAIALDPRYAEAFYNRGNALRDLHRHRDAIASYERALSLEPDHAAAHWNLADCLLLSGDFARGWQEYEWRWKLERGHDRREFEQPLWLGAPALHGRTILLHSELGLGDTLLFCRYAREVAATGARVLLQVQPSLLPLLADLEGAAQALPQDAPLPAFDYHCPLMSLPLAFKTDAGSIPAHIPYLRSDPERVAAWRERLGPKGPRPRIAIVWSGSMKLKNDRRSAPLAELLRLVAGWAEWISLQTELRDADLPLLASRPELRHVGGQLNDFADTAAALELADVLVTVDTSVAHVAGAMGKPVWILLPFNPHDWRWMLEREDSPWYPTARLFRQPAPGDWASVIDRVGAELRLRYGAGTFH